MELLSCFGTLAREANVFRPMVTFRRFSRRYGYDIHGVTHDPTIEVSELSLAYREKIGITLKFWAYCEIFFLYKVTSFEHGELKFIKVEIVSDEYYTHTEDQCVYSTDRYNTSRHEGMMFVISTIRIQWLDEMMTRGRCVTTIDEKTVLSAINQIKYQSANVCVTKIMLFINNFIDSDSDSIQAPPSPIYFPQSVDDSNKQDKKRKTDGDVDSNIVDEEAGEKRKTSVRFAGVLCEYQILDTPVSYNQPANPRRKSKRCDAI